ncbi:KilA-N domain-containing protein [Flavobacterium laiguense]|uniref:DNA-binding protein n=1 Tax=Flavobacterium laiguense TaxID=2169409 RepID=A0A2U1K014_9FLAO|nr:KilA-N domain-containing protein [Flavobacterium laiguense]PWA10811.1 DNA-binding protein [Flavobacterium laiguense]
MAKINVKNTEITIFVQNDIDFISLTDMSGSFKEGSALIGKWITNKNTLEYLGIWERIYNPDFNYPEFGVIENSAGINRFVMSVGQWIERTQAKGLLVKAGRYGGTFAHKDIAFHFAMWLSPEFQIHLIKEFQRLKEDEHQNIGWTAKRELSKINYHIHTDAVKQNLIPRELTSQQTAIIYANEADVLNMALFGVTAKLWRDKNPDLKGNCRDYASINELICLSNLENLNAHFINEKQQQNERLTKLNQIAIHQMSILEKVTPKFLK